MNRHVLLVAAVVATLGAGLAPPAQSAVRRGTFAGKTTAGQPVGFKVDRRGRVYAFSFDKITLSCTDGDTVDTPRIVTPSKVKFPVRKRHFGITARNKDTGFGWDAAGTFRKTGRRAGGTLKIFASFNADDKQDPNGSVRCESAELTWSASRA